MSRGVVTRVVAGIRRSLHRFVAWLRRRHAPVVEHVTPYPFDDDAGPPEDWLERVRRGAPALLEPSVREHARHRMRVEADEGEAPVLPLPPPEDPDEPDLPPAAARRASVLRRVLVPRRMSHGRAAVAAENPSPEHVEHVPAAAPAASEAASVAAVAETQPAPRRPAARAAQADHRPLRSSRTRTDPPPHRPAYEPRAPEVAAVLPAYEGSVRVPEELLPEPEPPLQGRYAVRPSPDTRHEVADYPAHDYEQPWPGLPEPPPAPRPDVDVAVRAWEREQRLDREQSRL